MKDYTLARVMSLASSETLKSIYMFINERKLSPKKTLV